jgi:hypothetical protein
MGRGIRANVFGAQREEDERGESYMLSSFIIALLARSYLDD